MRLRRPALVFVALGVAAGVATASTVVIPPPPPAAAGSATAAPPPPVAPHRPTVAQLTPPFSAATPPSDAVTTASGLTYKIITAFAGTTHPGINDTVLVNYTGWRPDGTTFYTTTTRGKPMPMPLASTAPGMTEALLLLGKGDRVMVWIPAAIGYRTSPASGGETLAYEIELVDIQAAPPVPADVAKPPKRAAKLAGGIRSIVVTAGTGGAGPALWDEATFHLTAWDANGHMRESTEVRQRPMTHTVYDRPPGLATALTSMNLGDRRRFWIPAPLTTRFGTGGGSARTLICYELELVAIKAGIAPPTTPTDVKGPPTSATVTSSGLAYRLLTSGAGTVSPTPADSVEVHYTGWTTDGRMFDSSIVRGAPATFPLAGVIAGWTEVLQHVVVGDTVRVWIPEALAYKGGAGKPAGMLVFDISLLSIK